MADSTQQLEKLLARRRVRVVLNSQVGLIASLGVVLLLILSLFWLGGSIGASETTADSQISAGEQLYVINCAPCHGRDGSGNASINAPAINQDGQAWLGSPVELEKHILEGGDGMPALAGQVKADEVHIILEFIQQWWTEDQRQTFQSNP